MIETNRFSLSDCNEIIFYDDGSSKIIHSSLHTIISEVTLSKEETDRLERVLKWR